MRRFEFVEGASRKFWQIEQQGSSLTIQWGKIGSAGQSQVKDFPSEAKAKAEHDKLVAEKTKKGYVETGAPPVGAPAPKPRAPKAAADESAKTAEAKPEAQAATSETMAAPVSPPGEAPEIDWSQPEAGHFFIAHPRGHLRPSAAELSADPWRAVQKKWSEWAPHCPWDKLEVPAELVPAVKEARAFLEGNAPIAVSPFAGVVLMELLYLYPWFEYFAALRGICEASVRAEGPAWLVDVALASTRVRIDTSHDAIRKKEIPEFNGFEIHPPSAGPFSFGTSEGRRLALYAATLPEDVYAALVAVVTERWPTLSYWQRLIVLALCPDQTPLADSIGEEWLACNGYIEGYARPSWDNEGIKPNFEFAYSRRVLVELAKKTVRMSFSNNYLQGSLYTLLELCGADVVPVCRIHCEHGDYGVITGLQVAARVRGPETASLMVSQLAGKRVELAFATEWLRKNPRLAIPPLADAIAAGSQLSDRAGPVFLDVDRENPGLVDSIELRPAARAAIQKLRDRMTAKPPASSEELPSVLVNPPWKSGKKAAPLPVVAGVTMLPYPDALHDDEGALERAREEHAAGSKYPTKYSEASKNVGARWYGKTVSLNLSHMKKSDIQKALSEWPGDAWGAGYHVLLPLAVLGPEAIDAYPRIAPGASAIFANALRDVVESPKLAGFYAYARTLKSARKSAELWLSKFPRAAAVGLVPIAVGAHTQARDQAEAALRHLVQKGHGELVREVAGSYGAEVSAVVEAILEADPRDRIPAKLPKIGAFANVDKLPRPSLRGRQKSLPKDAVEALFTMLAISTPDAPYAGLEDVLAACDRASLEDFSWALFNEWQLAGGNSKEAWGMQQLALLGGDEVARKLTPLIRTWPGASLQARAVAGLDILARIGSDLALMHLNGIAQKVKFKALQEKAREKMDEVAQNRGLSADELADRLVPDLDLDPDGSRTLDFGPRTFRVSFDEALKPVVVDSSGKTLGDLPKPNKSDDAAKAKEAEATWKTLKKDVKAIAQNQITRLELAMCSQRRWEVDSFRALFLEHPLLIHLVRRLVWGVYAEDGARLGAFRVAEDSSLADRDDAAFTLPEGAYVGLVHPLELPESERAAFGQILGDYAIVQPFPQIGRDTYAPTDAEATSSTITRRAGQFVPVGKILGMVERGWRKGRPEDAGWIWEMIKPLPGGSSATLALRTGIAADMQMTEPKQELGELYISKKNHSDMKLGELPPLVFSELVRDLVQLGSAS